MSVPPPSSSDMEPGALPPDASKESRSKADPTLPATNPTTDLRQTVNEARKKAGPGGDVNVVDVDTGAQVEQIAVGRNIFQNKITIGSIQFPVRTLLVLLVVAVLGAIAVWWIATPGKMQPGEGAASIAVVDFGMKDGAGTVSNSDQGKYLSEWLTNRLSSELDPNSKTTPVLWHISTGFDPLQLFRKRVYFGPVQDATQAQKVAEQFNADIVIYGTLEPGQGTVSFAPQFYVREPRASLEAPEFTGNHQMGKPIPLPAPLTSGALETYVQPLGPAILSLTRGLSLDILGNFAGAYEEFKNDEPNLVTWDRSQGKEIFYFFKGSEALFLAQCPQDAANVFPVTPERSAVDQALDQAEKDLNEAKAIQPDYARAYFGLGQVDLQRAQRLVYPSTANDAGQCRLPNTLSSGTNGKPSCPVPPTPDTSHLDEALKLYGQAIMLLDTAAEKMKELMAAKMKDSVTENSKDSPDTLMLNRIQGARGATEVPMAAALLLSGQQGEATDHLQNGVGMLEALKGTMDANTDPRGAATLYLALGGGHFLQSFTSAMANDPAGNKSHLQEAVGAYGTCLNIIHQNQGDAYLRDNLTPNCSCTQAAAQKALDQLK